MARCMKELLLKICNNGRLHFQHTCKGFVNVRYSSTVPSFKFKDLQITLTDDPKPKPDPDKLVFGKQFSDHMFEIPWSQEEGWGTPQIVPLHTINLHPAGKVFHYATELFEGMKAYRGPDDKIRLFRPMENINRMYSSAGRATLPQFDKEEFLKCLKKLVDVEREWVPYSTTSTLYIRPTMIATEPCLGVSSSTEALLYVITGPVGPYYPTGMKPVTLFADDRFVRSWPGGSGSFKMGSNYAPTMLAQKEAIKRGCQQVLWLYGEDDQLTEVGAMNLFLFWKNEKGEKELLTAPLDGLILPGITRKSVLELAREWDEFKVTERPYTMKEITKALKEHRVLELFGTGTACVVSPVEGILYKDEKLEIPTMRKGAKLAMRITKRLTDIQFGRQPHKWSEIVED